MTSPSLHRRRRIRLSIQELESRMVPANIFNVINTADAGAGSLRAAITAANNTANQADGPDEIRFAIPGGGVQIVNLQSALPTITQRVIIDGFTQPGASPNTLAAGNDAVIQIQINGAAAGNDANGLTLGANAAGSTIRGLAIVNFQGQFGDGIQIDGNNNTIEGCNLGIDAAGAAAGNLGSGVRVNGGANNTIGGTDPAARNVISANQVGVRIEDPTATGNMVLGNFIGTNAAGIADLGNRNVGVLIDFGAHGNIIGGLVPGAANVIAGTGEPNETNRSGVEIDGTDTANNTVQGNMIGTDLTGQLNLANSGRGVLVEDGAHDNLIGGAAVGAGNRIRFNSRGVVLRDNAVRTAILGNAIFDAIRAIDLGNDGDTDNDAGDGDAGDNNLQNHPILFGAIPGSTRVTGTLNSTPNTTYRIEFFSTSPEIHDVFSRGQGETFLGFLDVTTDAAGNADFNAELAANAPTGHFVAATATDPNGNTSEFSFAVQIAAPGSGFKLVDNLTDSIFDVFSLHVHGTAGDDVIIISGTTKNFKVTLNGASLGTFKGISNRIYLFGHGGNDNIMLRKTVKRSGFLFGGDGNDILAGAKVADQLRGEAGQDQLTGNQAADFLSGGADADTLRETGSGNYLLTDAALTRGAAIDALTAIERVVLVGSNTNNRMDASGFTGRAVLDGRGGNDVLIGGAGNDLLVGGPGRNTLNGNGGRDILIGGKGVDVLNGGAGSDLLLNGTLTLDIFGAPFAGVQAEWEREDVDYAAIVDHLKNGGGLNGDTVLGPVNVRDDTSVDRLTGGSELDWFFAKLQDQVLDLENNEIVN